MKFVPYNICQELKTKYFDEECLAYSENKNEVLRLTAYFIRNRDIHPQFFLRPTYQDVIDFFREKHKLVLDVFQEHDTANNIYTGNWLVDISKLGCYEEPHIIEITDTYSNYYNALNRAIEEAIKII